MYRNDRIGCCAVAAPANMMRAWAHAHAAMADRPVPTDNAIEAAYRAVSGYTPADPSTDVGCQMIDVLKLWRGQGIAGDQIGAYAAVEPANRNHVAIAVNLFGSCYVGADLPLASRDVPDAGVWDVAPIGRGHQSEWLGGSWGGHAMAVVGYDRTHVHLATWGRVQLATWEWFRAYVSEAWAVIDPLWIADDRYTPSGFDLVTLAADLARL
jgi:hypothetical protein